MNAQRKNRLHSILYNELRRRMGAALARSKGSFLQNSARAIFCPRCRERSPVATRLSHRARGAGALFGGERRHSCTGCTRAASPSRSPTETTDTCREPPRFSSA